MHDLHVILHAAFLGEHSLTDGTLGLPTMNGTVISERRCGEKLIATYPTLLAWIEAFV